MVKFERRGGIIMGRILIGLVALITMGTAAHAVTLAAGPLYGGSSQTVAVCYLFNADYANSVTVRRPEIISGGGTSLPLTVNNCPSTLAAGKTCNFYVNPITNTQAFGCRVIVSGTGTNVQGTLDIRSSLGTVLQVEQLR
jgi:hypothetical protein